MLGFGTMHRNWDVYFEHGFICSTALSVRYATFNAENVIFTLLELDQDTNSKIKVLQIDAFAG